MRWSLILNASNIYKYIYKYTYIDEYITIKRSICTKKLQLDDK